MKENPHHPDREQIQELLTQYENLRLGRAHSFLEEDAFEKIIRHYEETEDFGRAMEAAETAIEHFPYSGLLLIKKADLLLTNRQYQQALDLLDQAALFDNSDIDLYILKTDAYLALDQQEKAVQVLQQALDFFEGDDRIELLFELADVYDDYEEFDKVFDCLKLVLEQDPANEEALYKICFWTDFTGRNEESIRLHQQIIDENPYSELAWFNLAAAYQGLNLYEKAIDAYQYAITIEEKFDYAYRNMGDAYIRLRKYREAIEALNRVTELSKPESVIYEAIGHCYDKLKNFAQARFHYRKASHLNQEDSRLFYKIACTYFNEQRWESCMKQLDQAMKIHRNQPEYSLLMGRSKMEAGVFREAVQYLADAVRMRPRNLSGWEALLRCLYTAGYWEEGIAQADQAYRATGNKPVFLYYSAALLIGSGKTKEALLVFEEAMEKAPKQLKKFIDLNPAVLQLPQVVDIIARYKRNKSI